MRFGLFVTSDERGLGRSQPLQGAALLRIPERNTSGRSGVVSQLGRCRTEHLGNERRNVVGQETVDLGNGGHEGLGQLVVGRAAHDHEQRDPVLYHRRQLVRLISDAAIVSEGDPTAFSDGLEPLLVAGRGSEVFAMKLDAEAGGPQDLREPGTEIAVGEEDMTQAVRS